jgi:nitroreductase
MKTKQNQEAEIHPILGKRWSPRAFSSRSIPEDTLKALFEAARWAPSSFNEQPWRFIYATQDQPNEFTALLECLNEKNRIWAQDAYLLFVALAKQTFTKNGKPNRHAGHDVGQAIAHLTFQATADDLYIHQMGGFSAEKVSETYEVPSDFEPMTMVAVGYLGAVSQLPDDLQGGEMADQKRNPSNDWLSMGKWPQ